MSSYRKDFDETRYIFFVVKDDELLEKYNEIWKKVSLKKKNDSEPVYNEIYLKIKNLILIKKILIKKLLVKKILTKKIKKILV